MYELDLTSLRGTLVKSVRIMVYVRRLAKEVKLDCTELEDLEREIRERAAEVQGAWNLQEAGQPVVLIRG